VDSNALKIAQKNCEELEVDVDFILADIEHYTTPLEFEDQQSALHDSKRSLFPRVDTVIMNPPFGTKVKGLDMLFLQKAIQV
jgi:predicted RNA methylase